MITCNQPTTHHPSGCALLKWSDTSGDGIINTTNTAKIQLANGEITQEEFDFIEKAVNAGSINALCPGCYSETPPGITCDSPTDNHSSGCALLNWSDRNNDGIIISMITADKHLAEGLITQREHDFVYKAWEAGSINALCPGCYSETPPETPAAGRIVDLTYPASVKHGALCDINASTENISTISGVFEMQLFIDSVLKAKSSRFALEGGATTTDRIEPFTAPSIGKSMAIMVKCIRIT